MRSLIFLAILAISNLGSNGELFTAIVDLQSLLETERVLISSIDDYIASEYQRIEHLRLVQERHRKLNQEAEEDGETNLSNPINAYLLVKRLAVEWKDAEIRLITSNPNGQQLIRNLTEKSIRYRFPGIEDFTGSSSALIRLQKTYQLSASELAKGRIPRHHSHDSKHKSKLSTSRYSLTSADCFELGKNAASQNDHDLVIDWMREALKHWEAEPEKHIGDKIAIMDYLSYATHKQGNTSEAIKLTEEILKIAPENKKIRDFHDHYKALLLKKESNLEDGEEVDNEVVSEEMRSWLQKQKRYEALCRGEDLDNRDRLKLSCYNLDTRDKPYLRLMKIKIEQASRKPEVLIYHDVLSESEIETIKNISIPRLKRATVNDNSKGGFTPASYRISKSAWLNDADGDTIQRINRRFQTITGLSTESAEDLQVVNYGIGGHYEAHYDFAMENEKGFHMPRIGNRIATWLNYMSDVDAGGATVFPELGITVWPKKGSALFWWNLKRNGRGDIKTKHAACPVLIGSKWIVNKWYHEFGQEFVRPCTLKADE